MLNMDQVVCPVNGTLCCGVAFDCYSKCSRQVSDKKAFNRQQARDHERWVEGRLFDFKLQMERWTADQPCPRCGAAAPVDERQKHERFHKVNDQELQF